MCGIAGLFRPGGATAEDGIAVARMLDRISHRGPDGHSIHQQGAATLGVVRLAIMDPDGGRQPFLEEGVAVVGNGEIYNQQQLRRAGLGGGSRCDLGVLPGLVARDGAQFPRALEGPFAIAAHCSDRDQLLLARDRIGIKPLFICRVGERLAFASEMKALLVFSDVGLRLDAGAVRDALLTGFVLGPRTILKGIRAVPPGTVLLTQDGRSLAEHRYWEFPGDSPIERPMDLEGAAREARRPVRRAVRDRLVSDVRPVGCFLSGGIDSSGVAALAAQVGRESLITYTLVGGQERSGAAASDAEAAARVAAHAGVPNRRVGLVQMDSGLRDRLLWHLETPVTNLGNARALWSLSQATARDGVRAVLMGEGADEVFGGYAADLVYHMLEQHDTPAASRIARLLQADRGGDESNEALCAAHRTAFAEIASGLGYVLPALAHPLLARFGFARRMLPLLLADSAVAAEPGPVRPGYVNPELADALPSSTRAAYVDLRTRLEAYILPTRERVAMAWGVETRFPFLNHNVVGWGLHLPPELRWEGERLKAVWRAAITADLPRSLADRPKRGLFVRSPLDAWKVVDSPDLTLEALEESGVFDPVTTTALASRIRDTGEQTWHRLDQDLLERVDMIQRIHRLFVRDRGRCPSQYDG